MSNTEELVAVIKREDSIATMKIQQLAAGGTQAPRRKIRERIVLLYLYIIAKNT